MAATRVPKCRAPAGNTAAVNINVAAAATTTPAAASAVATLTPIPNVWDAPSTSQPGMIMLVIGMLGALLIFLTKSRSRIKADKGLSR